MSTTTTKKVTPQQIAEMHEAYSLACDIAWGAREAHGGTIEKWRNGRGGFVDYVARDGRYYSMHTNIDLDDVGITCSVTAPGLYLYDLTPKEGVQRLEEAISALG